MFSALLTLVGPTVGVPAESAHQGRLVLAMVDGPPARSLQPRDDAACAGEMAMAGDSSMTDLGLSACIIVASSFPPS